MLSGWFSNRKTSPYPPKTMKFLFCYLAVLFMSVFQLAAQPRWNVSLKAGAGWTGVWETRDSPYSIIEGFKERFVPNRGLVIGAQVNYRLSPRFGIDVGLEYQTMKDELQRSFDKGGSAWEVNYSVYNSARRVQMPLQLRYQFSSRPQSVYVLAGVAAGYLRSVELYVSDQEIYDIPFKLIDRSQLPRGYLPRYQFPLLAGVGVSVGRHVAFELIYQYMHREMEFLRYDPRFTTIGLTPSVSRMNRGLFLSAKYRFKKLY